MSGAIKKALENLEEIVRLVLMVLIIRDRNWLKKDVRK